MLVKLCMTVLVSHYMNPVTLTVVLIGYHFKVSLGRNSLVTVLEGGPSSEWWRVETDQGVQVCTNTPLRHIIHKSGVKVC